jgi:hypothetical protein
VVDQRRETFGQPTPLRSRRRLICGEHVKMGLLDAPAVEIVEQLAVQSVSQFPLERMPVVEKLVDQGVVERQGDQWRLTKVGLILLGYALQGTQRSDAVPESNCG